MTSRNSLKKGYFCLCVCVCFGRREVCAFKLVKFLIILCSASFAWRVAGELSLCYSWGVMLRLISVKCWHLFFFFPIINLSHSYQTPNVSAGFPELLVKITFAFGKLWTFKPQCFQLPPVDSVKPLHISHCQSLALCPETRSLCTARLLFQLYPPSSLEWRKCVNISSNRCRLCKLQVKLL